MYGGSSKLGGRGGGGRNKRLPHTSFTPPPPRTSAPNRLSLGGCGASSSGTRNRVATTATAETATSASGSEETISLVSSDKPLAFGMIVKLSADFTEEIKKVGAQGGPMRVKFDRMNNPSSNVIDVGGKEFNFRWHRDICYIYEECQSGDDGNGLLIEYGCSWRKLNLQRILDETTKQQYKKRSEEAERLQKSRRAIVLDHESPSMKSQIKQIAAVEVNPRMHFRNKKEHPFKKRRADPPPVGNASNSAFRSGPSSKSTTKIRHSTPPVSSSPESFTQPSPSGIVNIKNFHATNKDLVATGKTSKDTVASSEKEIANKATNAVQETTGHKRTVATKSEDIQSILVSLLTENPKGMNLKALEKALGDKIPNTAKIEPIIKKIATLQAPGRYILKQGVELESFKKPLSEGGRICSSPEDHHHFPTSNKEIRAQAVQELSTTDKGPIYEVGSHAMVNHDDEDEPVDIVDIVQHSPNLPGIKKDFNVSDGLGASSTDSGSDSDTDSDSSDSESDSGSPSRSRSKSPAESGSGSSSDSDSDVSSNSKDGSDVDVHVDILGDDDKGPEHNLKFSDPRFSSSPMPWGSDEQPLQNGITGNEVDGNESDAVEIEKDMPQYEHEADLNVVNSVVPNSGDNYHVEGTETSSPDQDKLRECRKYIGKLFDEGDEAGKDSLRNDHPDSYKRTSKGKSKRRDSKHSDSESKRVKRLREESLTHPSVSDGRDLRVSGSPYNSGTEKIYDLYKAPSSQPSSRADLDSSVDEIHAKQSSDSQHSGKKFYQSWQAKAAEHSGAENRASAGPGRKYPDKGSYGHDSFPPQNNKIDRDTQFDPNHVNESRIPRHNKEASDGGRNPIPLDSHFRKLGESAGKFKEAGQVPNFNIRSSPKENFGNGTDRSPVLNGRGSIHQREPSDLEVGEFCEPLPDVVPGRKQFERKSSFKQTDSDCNKVKSGGKGTTNLVTPLPGADAAVPNSTVSSQKWSTPDRRVEDKLGSHRRIMQTQSQQPARIDHESGSQFNNFADAANKSRQGETGVSKSTSTIQKRDPKRGTVSTSVKDNGLQMTSNGSQKMRESSSDENSSYSKYEKDEPELKGPIRDFSQYEDYVQEYRDKYDSYCSLNKVLESYRNEFQKLGKDLEAAKGRDTGRYYDILGQMKESYHRCGTRHKRLKRVFIILHEELKNLKQRIKDFAGTYAGD